MDDIPAFLDRRRRRENFETLCELQNGEFLSPGPQSRSTPMTTEATKTKTKRKDCLVIRQTVKIPLDMTDAESLGTTIKAGEAMKANLPAGSIVEGPAPTLGKL